MNTGYQEYGFEKLEVYKLAENLTQKIYRITNTFPKEEVFGLTSQLRRASVSVALNLAEGSSQRSKNDFSRFVSIALGSIIETKAALRLAMKLGFISQSEFSDILPQIDEIFFKTTALKNSLMKK